MDGWFGSIVVSGMVLMSVGYVIVAVTGFGTPSIALVLAGIGTLLSSLVIGAVSNLLLARERIFEPVE